MSRDVTLPGSRLLAEPDVDPGFAGNRLSGLTLRLYGLTARDVRRTHHADSARSRALMLLIAARMDSSAPPPQV